MYDDGAAQVFEGCDCKGKVFFYLKGDRSPNEIPFILTTAEQEKVLSLDHHDRPVVLDVEAINMLREGSHEIDVVNLMRDKAAVYRVGDGKYYIDIEQTLERRGKKK